ncbi:MAG: M23 family metallopeptidase, partial [Planctomycetota bacterium]
MRKIWMFIWLLSAALMAASPAARAEDRKPGEGEGSPTPAKEKKATPFCWPCEEYLSGLRRGGNFGAFISRKANPAFAGTYHLGEDAWLPGGTPVRAVADGVVMYSDFSPTWTDKRGRKHWNLGNVIVIEHKLAPPDGELKAVCSVYVHLAKDRKVKTGQPVKRGQRI